VRARDFAFPLVVGLALGSPPLLPLASGQPASAGTPAGPAALVDVRVAEGRVSLDARDVPLADLLRVIGERAGVPMHLEGDLSTPVTRVFTNVPLEQAIQRLARGHSLSFAFAGPERPGGQGGLAEVWVISASPQAGRPVPAAPANPLANPPARATDLQAVQALARRSDPEAAVELGRMLAQDTDPAVRSRAATALGRVSGPQAAAGLTAALGDEAVSVRIQALRSLRQVAGEQAIDPIARVLAADPDPSVRRTAARLLGELPGPAAQSALRSAAADDADESVRRAATEALARSERTQ
jgi:hypothetical protein